MTTEMLWTVVAVTDDLVIRCWSEGPGGLSGDVEPLTAGAEIALGHCAVFYEFAGSREHLVALAHDVPPALLVADRRFQITGWPDDID